MPTDSRIDTPVRALVASCCLLIALLYVWQTVAGYQAIERDAVRQSVALAGSLAQQTETSFELTDSVLQRMQFWAQLRGVAPPQRQLLRDLLRVRTPSMQAIGELTFFDRAGEPIVRSGAPPSPETADTERRAFAFHAGHPGLGPLVLAPASAERRGGMIVVSRRFDDHRRHMAGIVLATMPVSSLRPVYDGVDTGKNGAITLLLADGSIVLQSPFRRVPAVAQRWNDDVAARARGVDAGHFTGRSPLDGLDRVTAYRTVAGFPLIVTVGFATADTFAVWRLASILGFIGACGGIVAIVLLARSLLREIARNREARSQLAHLAARDGLTGLWNRRELDAALQREWQAGARERVPLALLMIDVDSFKAYNDRYGHQRGDEILVRIAGTLREHCNRPRDIVARYGGEEFVALLPATNGDGALYVAENLRRRVEDLCIENLANEPPVVTVSVGVAAVVPAADGNPADLVRTADMRMYEAKRSGRNRVNADAPPVSRSRVTSTDEDSTRSSRRR